MSAVHLLFVLIEKSTLMKIQVMTTWVCVYQPDFTLLLRGRTCRWHWFCTWMCWLNCRYPRGIGSRLLAGVAGRTATLDIGKGIPFSRKCFLRLWMKCFRNGIYQLSVVKGEPKIEESRPAKWWLRNSRKRKKKG